MAGDEGFRVDLPKLKGYAGTLQQDVHVVEDAQRLAHQADQDVGQQAWGIPGIFLQGDYTTMANELNGLLDDMHRGIQDAARKIGEIASEYEHHDGHGAQAFQDVMSTLDEVQKPR